ncbi:MAG: hypothetical protein E7099_03955 [Mediterranea massiliensis]|nr:hypothetical protein [Mediterranea massiliensis]
MKLIADSSSTRTEWALIEGREVIHHAITEGLNPYFQTRREISHSVRLGLPAVFFKKKAELIHYYGAGCSTPEKKSIIEASLVAQFKAPIEVKSDLLAAAHGLMKNEAGIACILGTGSNSCLYDGKKIVKNIRSGGYILGDEGSGAALGRYFLADIIKDLAPQELKESFFDSHEYSYDELLDAIYNHPFPNRFLAYVSRFLEDYTEMEYVHDLITKNFRNFFIRNICQYDYKEYPIRFVGSQAYSHTKLLQEVAAEFGTQVDLIEDTAMKGLIEYHSQKV